MNTALKRFSRMNCNQVERLQFAQALRRLGVNRPAKIRGSGEKVQQPIHQMSHSALWDLYDSAKRRWLQLIKQLHPDKGGDSNACAVVNAIWDRVQTLFAQLGIG